MAKLHSLTVKSIHRSTDECVVVELNVPVDLKETFSFKQGQYLTLEATIHNETVRRSYSLCSAPTDEEWKVAIKKVPNGKFSTFANDQLQIGDTLSVMKPMGTFFVPVQQESKRYVFFAAGSGITPIYSIIKTHLSQEPGAVCTLFFTNKNAHSIILKAEIEDLKNQYLDRFSVYYFLTQELRSTEFLNGRMDKKKLDFLVDKIIPVKQMDEVFICGPNEMIFLIKEYLEEQKVPNNKIHFELFNSNNLKPRQQETITESGNLTKVRLTEGGRTYLFTTPTKGINILDAALAQKVDLPYACKGGVCCTCRAKLIKGEVEMELDFGLEAHEKEAGYILTCQAVPLSDELIIDFEA